MRKNVLADGEGSGVDMVDSASVAALAEADLDACEVSDSVDNARSQG